MMFTLQGMSEYILINNMDRIEMSETDHSVTWGDGCRVSGPRVRWVSWGQVTSEPRGTSDQPRHNGGVNKTCYHNIMNNTREYVWPFNVQPRRKFYGSMHKRNVTINLPSVVGHLIFRGQQNHLNCIHDRDQMIIFQYSMICLFSVLTRQSSSNF